MKKYPWQIEEEQKQKHDRNIPPPPWYKHNPAFRPISDLTDEELEDEHLKVLEKIALDISRESV